MDSFPYDTWEEALADGGEHGYFTWANGAGSVVLTILGLALAIAWIVWITMNEDQHLKNCASRLNEKWGI